MLELLVLLLNCLETRKIKTTLVVAQSTTNTLGIVDGIRRRNVGIVLLDVVRTRIYFYTIV